VDGFEGRVRGGGHVCVCVVKVSLTDSLCDGNLDEMFTFTCGKGKRGRSTGVDRRGGRAVLMVGIPTSD